MSFQDLKIAVIIPAFRAENTIQKVLSGIPDWVDAIYVVNDASPDETATGRVPRGIRACG
jgi:glycosyltransferase involved in cell wall biosynthesis